MPCVWISPRTHSLLLCITISCMTPIAEEAQWKPTAELRREGRLAHREDACLRSDRYRRSPTDLTHARLGEANSPECRQLIAEFLGDEWEEMRARLLYSMWAIAHALCARREHLTSGPDRYPKHFGAHKRSVSLLPSSRKPE